MNPRLISVTLAALLAAAAGLAQFDFGKLTKALDTAKDAGKAMKGVTGIGIEEERELGDCRLESHRQVRRPVRDEDIMRRVNRSARAGPLRRPDLDWEPPC